jgi:TPP-dependent pyruvate/acetoin dehydrogenase alpha subunit
VLIECDTLRMRGHGEHDDFSYVPRQLLDAYAARDPLRVAAERLAREGMIPPDEFDAIDRACVAEVDQAYHEALAEPAPDPSTLLKGVYSDD